MTTMKPNLSSSTPFRLGFGCGSLGSDLDYKSSCILIEYAFECGFRHFDVAPSYGNGLAERILGDVLSSVRDSVTIVTKAGIPHPRAESGFRLARRMLLPLKAMFPLLWAAGANRARTAAAPRGRFARNEMTLSIAESLKRLRTDHVDALLLHEIWTEDWSDDLNNICHDFRSQGMTKGIGLGASIDSSINLLELGTGIFDYVQVDHYWGAFIDPLRVGDHVFVTHSCLRNGWQKLKSQAFLNLLGSGDVPRDLELVIADPELQAEILLSAGLQQNSHGTVLVSTSRKERVNKFAKIGQSPDVIALGQQLNILFSQMAQAETEVRQMVVME